MSAPIADPFFSFPPTSASGQSRAPGIGKSYSPAPEQGGDGASLLVKTGLATHIGLPPNAAGDNNPMLAMRYVQQPSSNGVVPSAFSSDPFGMPFFSEPSYFDGQRGPGDMFLAGPMPPRQPMYQPAPSGNGFPAYGLQGSQPYFSRPQAPNQQQGQPQGQQQQGQQGQQQQQQQPGVPPMSPPHMRSFHARQFPTEQLVANKLFVGGLSYDLTEAELVMAFARYGAQKANIICDRETGRSRGYGFVTFDSEGSANEAMNYMQGAEVHGRRIRIGRATARTPGPRHFQNFNGKAGGRHQNFAGKFAHNGPSPAKEWSSGAPAVFPPGITSELFAAEPFGYPTGPIAATTDAMGW